jgi:hypothetical protein
LVWWGKNLIYTLWNRTYRPLPNHSMFILNLMVLNHRFSYYFLSDDEIDKMW